MKKLYSLGLSLLLGFGLTAADTITSLIPTAGSRNKGRNDNDCGRRGRGRRHDDGH